MTKFQSLAGLAATFALIGPAQAHPGHALGAHGPLHAVTSPYHLAILALIGAGLWIGARFVQRRGTRQMLRCSGVATLLLACVLLGLRA